MSPRRLVGEIETDECSDRLFDSVGNQVELDHEVAVLWYLPAESFGERAGALAWGPSEEMTARRRRPGHSREAWLRIQVIVATGLAAEVRKDRRVMHLRFAQR